MKTIVRPQHPTRRTMAGERLEGQGTANLCFYFYFCDKSTRLLTYVKYVMEGRFDIPALVVSPPAPSLLSVISEGPWSGCNGLSTLSSPLYTPHSPLCRLCSVLAPVLFVRDLICSLDVCLTLRAIYCVVRAPLRLNSCVHS